jgi:NlpC/P60 family putative phage cell wall peptidase
MTATPVTGADVTRQAVVDAARGWRGTRYQHQARLRGRAVDCIGLIIGVAQELGLLPPGFDPAAFANYGREPDPAILLGACDQFLDRIARAQAGPGDILVLRFAGAGSYPTPPQHFALVTEPGYMVHAYAAARRVVEHRIDAAWEARIVRCYRLRGVRWGDPSDDNMEAA